MQRIKLAFPESLPFSTILRVRITDLNYGGHVGNDAFLSLAHEARQQYLQHYGFTELKFAGTGLIMADAAIEYKAELNWENEVKISVGAGDFDRLGFDIYYLFEILTPDKNILAAKIKTGMMCYDYNLKKRMPVPEEAIRILMNA